MSQALQPSLLRGLRYTPLTDLLRGRLSARLDARTRVANSDLPAEVRQVLRNVLSRIRLDRGEKLSVADELIAHFRDGLDAGAAPADLIESFGDARMAARLLTRAKRRQRRLLRHFITAIKWAIVALVALYALTAVRFYTGRVNPSVNYAQVINARLPVVPQSDQAWLTYRDALPVELRNADYVEFRALTSAQPGDAKWDELKSALNDIDLPGIRKASRLPALGFRLGESSLPEDEIRHDRDIGLPSTAQSGPLLQGLLAYLPTLRRLSGIVAADSRVAASEGAIARIIDNFETLNRLADQLDAYPLFFDNLTMMQIRKDAVISLQVALASSRVNTIDEGQLVAVAHHLSRHQVAAEFFDFNDDRPVFLDGIQRLYTDNGRGDGFLPATFLSDGIEDQRPFQDFDEHLFAKVAAPTSPILLPSRKEVIATYEQLLAIAQANIRVPMRDADWKMYVSSTEGWRIGSFIYVHNFLPAYWRVQIEAERYFGLRDGALIAIALELYSREHGDYPATLDALSPTYLPTIPVDRITGGPLHYSVTDGSPLVYSVGIDRDDDAGRLPVKKRSDGLRHTAANWVLHPWESTAIFEGDWVLYPADSASEQ